MEGLGAIFSAGISSIRRFSSRQPNARGLKSPEDRMATARHADIGSSQPLSKYRRYLGLARGIRQSLPQTRGLKSPEDGIPTASRSDFGFSPPPSETHRYYDLAKRIRQSLPQTVEWLSSADVQITDGVSLSAGGNSDVFGGSYQGRSAVVKSLRRYSSPEFDPVEAGIVRLRLSARLA